MPGLQLQTTAFILIRQPSGSDSFEQFTAFSPEHGVLHCLRRLSSGRAPQLSSKARRAAPSSAAPIDLFDEAELWLESSNQGRTWFIKECRIDRRHTGIGRSYEALRRAAGLATLLTRNPVPDESRAAVTTLLTQTFTALSDGARPDLVWLKTLFCFARDEGYAVKQQWWRQLSSADRTAATAILNQPLAGQTADAAIAAHLIQSLEAWLQAHTDIRLE